LYFSVCCIYILFPHSYFSPAQALSKPFVMDTVSVNYTQLIGPCRICHTKRRLPTSQSIYSTLLYMYPSVETVEAAVTVQLKWQSRVINTSFLTISGLKHRLALQWHLNGSYLLLMVLLQFDCWGNVTFCILLFWVCNLGWCTYCKSLWIKVSAKGHVM